MLSSIACTAAGRQYDLGVGVRRDMNRAMELYALACEWGQGRACVYLLEGHAGSTSPSVDRGRSYQLTAAACERGDQDACAGVGFAFDEGVGVSEDSARIMGRYNRAMDGF